MIHPDLLLRLAHSRIDELRRDAGYVRAADRISSLHPSWPRSAVKRARSVGPRGLSGRRAGRGPFGATERVNRGPLGSG